MKMLTEVDIEHIMAAKRQLAESLAAESVAGEVRIKLADEDEAFELLEEDTSASETNGLM